MVPWQRIAHPSLKFLCFGKAQSKRAVGTVWTPQLCWGVSESSSTRDPAGTEMGSGRMDTPHFDFPQATDPRMCGMQGTLKIIPQVAESAQVSIISQFFTFTFLNVLHRSFKPVPNLEPGVAGASAVKNQATPIFRQVFLLFFCHFSSVRIRDNCTFVQARAQKEVSIRNQLFHLLVKEQQWEI